MPTRNPLAQPPARRPGFTLIELLVVISIIGILIGLLLPVLANVRLDTKKVTCASNMRQLGIALGAYTAENKEIMPVARYMPPPLVSADDDPPLHVALEDQLPLNPDGTNEIWHCPDDDLVFELSGSSYDYLSVLSGKRMDQFLPVRLGFITEGELVIVRDFDNASADIEGQDDPLEVPARHLRRNNLWGDGRVSVVDLE